jgi:hypothetical protein
MFAIAIEVVEIAGSWFRGWFVVKDLDAEVVIFFP